MALSVTKIQRRTSRKCYWPYPEVKSKRPVAEFFLRHVCVMLHLLIRTTETHYAYGNFFANYWADQLVTPLVTHTPPVGGSVDRHLYLFSFVAIYAVMLSHIRRDPPTHSSVVSTINTGMEIIKLTNPARFLCKRRNVDQWTWFLHGGAFVFSIGVIAYTHVTRDEPLHASGNMVDSVHLSERRIHLLQCLGNYHPSKRAVPPYWRDTKIRGLQFRRLCHILSNGSTPLQGPVVRRCRFPWPKSTNSAPRCRFSGVEI